jgi:hypothetical protein
LHIIWTDILLPFFRQRRSFVPGAHIQVTRQISRRLVRGLLQMANMIMEFQNAVGAHADSGRRRFCGSKISENLCGVFDALCYIPAPLTNRN